jgi:hypothetical protein
MNFPLFAQIFLEINCTEIMAFLIAYIKAMLKVKFPLCFFNRIPRHEGVLGEWMLSSTHSLTSILDGGEWSASHFGLFTPQGKIPGTHWIGGRVGPRAGLDTVSKRKISGSRREPNPGVQSVVSRYTN